MIWLWENHRVVSPKEQMKQFGTYLQELLEEGRVKELRQYQISEELDWEKNKINLPQFAEYAKYCFNSMAHAGAILLKTDLNEDGIADVIEYLSDVGFQERNEKTAFSLTIYLGNADGSYQVAYFKPYFATGIYNSEDFFIVKYQGEVYFLFARNQPPSDENVEVRIEAYSYQEGTFIGKLKLSCEYSELLFGDIEGEYGEEARRLAERAGCRKRYTIDESKKMFDGDAEEKLGTDSKEYARLQQIGFVAEGKYQNQASTGSQKMLGMSALRNVSDEVIYQSDLDNDGKKEIYAKRHSLVGIFCGDYFRKKGKEYGEHAGNWGLLCTMMKEGEETTFLELGGLDIWGTEWIPQMFCVKEEDGKNIVYLKYEDSAFENALVEGYYIHDGGYEKVASVQFRSKVSCTLEYEWKEAGEEKEPLHYMVTLLKKGERNYQYPELYGMEEKELQNTINEEIEKELNQKIVEFLEKQGKDTIYDYARCNIFFATQEELLLKYALIYSPAPEARAFRKDMMIAIDRISGEVSVILLEGDIEFYVYLMLREEEGW